MGRGGRIRRLSAKPCLFSLCFPETRLSRKRLKGKRLQPLHGKRCESYVLSAASAFSQAKALLACCRRFAGRQALLCKTTEAAPAAYAAHSKRSSCLCQPGSARRYAFCQRCYAHPPDSRNGFWAGESAYAIFRLHRRFFMECYRFSDFPFSFSASWYRCMRLLRARWAVSAASVC